MQNTLSALRVNDSERTTITVAHSLATVLQFDYVYVLKDGRIAESGTPSALLAESVLFRGLLVES